MQILIWLGSVIIVLVLYSSDVFVRLNYQVYDARMASGRADTVLPDDIRVVLIDESSLQVMSPVLGNFPWPRSVYAELLEFFAIAGARAVVFDVLFTESEGGRFVGEHQTNTNDQLLAQASAEYGNAYHAILMFEEYDEQGQPLPVESLPEDFKQRFAIQQNGLEPSTNNHFLLSYPELAASTPNIGVVGVDPELDGVYRRVQLFFNYQQAFYPSLSVSPLLDWFGIERVSRDTEVLLMGEQNIPVDRDDRMLVNFYGDYQAYSMASVIASLLKLKRGELADMPIFPDEFTDKIIFIGASAVGLDDIKATPVSSKTPGVFIHAAATGNMLSGDLLKPATFGDTLLAILLLTGFTSLVTFRVEKFSLRLVIPLLLIGCYWWITAATMKQNYVMNTVTPIAALLITWLGSLLYLGVIEGSDKRKVKKMLSQYVSPSVLTEVMSHPDTMLHAQVGETEEMSILFSDIRSFTTISENNSAQDVVKLLNCYFGEMTDAIFEYDGTLDKFIGDAIMAFWGAPIRSENHAYQSVLAALSMVDRLELVNERLKEQNLPIVNVGIGINSGDVILGNIGSERKLDFTVIGDNVNLASRTEGLTKNYGVQLLITESTRAALPNDVICQRIDRVRVKGKLIPIEMYAPMAIESSPADRVQQAKIQVDLMDHALELYYQQQWQAAIEAFSKLANPVLVELYIDRCHQFQQQPPGKDWDGVYTALSK